MFNKVLITGDTHCDFTRFRNYSEEFQKDSNAAVIILGDAGLNWTLDEGDSHIKNMLKKRYQFRIYCVRGNHEARPSDVPGMELIYDEDVQGEVWMQAKWPNIRYFKDYAIYNINGYKVGVIGGAYSVDKWYRIQRNGIWFYNEQLFVDEQREALALFANQTVDFMLTHTCPIEWEPTDLFLRGIDQSKVDKTMEIFLEEVKETLDFDVWIFGHYHDDRLVRPGVEMFYKDTEDIEDIWKRWQRWEEFGELDWWLSKDNLFFSEVEGKWE